MLVKSIESHHSSYADELNFKPRFLELLKHPRAFFRDHLPGHITASAMIIDRSAACMLLTHHAKLNRWLQPGGHADGEEDTAAVAMREAREETGLTSLTFADHCIFDLDIHLIPARENFPAHDHYDVRYLLMADKDELLTLTAESHDLAWIALKDLPRKTGNNQSILRMVKKLKGNN